jgi:hypothetical protein
MAELDAAIGKLFLRDGSGRQVAAIRRLGAAMQVAPDWFASWHSAMALFEDPLVGKMASLSPQSVVEEAREAALDVQRLLDEVRDEGLRHDLGFVSAAIVFAAEKVETTRAIQAWLRAAVRDDSTAESAERLAGLIAALHSQARKLSNLKREFEARWLAEARRSEIQQNLDRYEKLAERYAAAISWLEEQGRRHAAGDSIDVEITTYDRGDYAVLHEATRRQIKELVDIIGIDSIPPDLLPWVDAPEALESKGKS